MHKAVTLGVPCYNKEKWILASLKSIEAQDYVGDIELILVNDGSTDGTRKIMGDWVKTQKNPRIKVVLIDQENKGVSGAVRTSIENATGEYIAFPDCDDILFPDYVSILAVYLDMHKDVDFVIANSTSCNYTQLCRRIRYFGGGGICTSMYRHEFLVKRVSPNLEDKRISQEPQIKIPAFYYGKVGTINKVVYQYVQEATALNQYLSNNSSSEFPEKYHEINIKTIELLKAPEEQKNFFKKMSKLYCLYRICQRDFGNETYESPFFDIVMELFPELKLAKKMYKGKPEPLAHLIFNRIDGITAEKIEHTTRGKIIGYGAKRLISKSILFSLLETHLRPNVLWDVDACDGDEIFGYPITKPKFEGLTENDTVIMLDDRADDVDFANAECRKVNARFFIRRQVMYYIAEILFGNLITEEAVETYRKYHFYRNVD